MQHAINLIEQIAADPSDPRHAAATAVMKEVQEAMAPPVLKQILDVEKNDDLDVDDHAFMDRTDEGVWVQTWSWVSRECVPELYPDEGEPVPSDEENPEP
ncbi:hypothetical protein A0U91_17055 (plasmid) [Acetobacter persici]|uniref:Uncharacterized protein n=2 Tax=Acetobacter persici TaxID=1076596 RepID=A0A1U9LJW6_9PROT|nr:hypothetical protein A0U91_17055 [Acetobacter persici]